jgi:CubicO group peptidase (beta-lactamase class C family)
MEKWNYSNSGYFLLGVIIEKAAGEPYDSFLRKNIFHPLKMTGSGYDRFATILRNRATGYSFQKGGRVNSTYLDMSQPAAAGSLYSTVEDLFAWNEALFNGNLLSPKSLAAMTTPALNNYGYGVGIAPMLKRKTVSHGGGINGFNTYLIRYLDDKVTIAVLRNQDYGAPSPAKITETLAAMLFGEKIDAAPAAPPAVAKVDPKIYDAYVGEYQLAPTFIIAISREGDRLMAQATGQPLIELFPESETKFFLKVVDAKVTFVRDAGGKTTHLILHQGGDQQAKKIK